MNLRRRVVPLFLKIHQFAQRHPATDMTTNRTTQSEVHDDPMPSAGPAAVVLDQMQSGRALDASEDGLSTAECVDNYPGNFEWTADHLYEQLLTIGWVEKVFDGVAEKLRRHLAATSKAERTPEELRCGRR